LGEERREVERSARFEDERKVSRSRASALKVERGVLTVERLLPRWIKEVIDRSKTR